MADAELEQFLAELESSSTPTSTGDFLAGLLGRVGSRVGAALEPIGRPARAVSEALGAGLEGKSPLTAARMALRGSRPRYPSIGERVFPGEPGFDLSDVAAEGIDLATDPLTYAGPGLVKGAAKLGVTVGAKLVPKFAPILKALPKAEPALQLTAKAERKALRSANKVLQSELGALGLGPRAAVRRVWTGAPKPVVNAMAELVQSGRAPRSAVDFFRASLRDLDANFRPEETFLSSAARSLSERLSPVSSTLRNFGGPAGVRKAKLLEESNLAARARWARFAVQLKALDQATQAAGVEPKLLSQLREGLVDPATVSAKANGLAGELGRILDDFGQESLAIRDPFGRELQAFNPYSRKSIPFSEALVPNWYPHVWPAKLVTGRQENLVRYLIEQGVPENRAAELAAAIQRARPRKVGHVDYQRVKGAKGYIDNPFEAVPVALWRSILRQETARRLGVNGELLETLLGDLERTSGLNPSWVRRVGDMVTGRTQADRQWSSMLGTLTSYEAVSKLGFATSAANLLQAPFGITIRYGPLHLVRSLLAKPDEVLRASAFSRGVADDVLEAAGGRAGGALDWFYNTIGMSWTERSGRHLAGIAGKLEIQDLARRAAAGDARAVAKLAERYGISNADLLPDGSVAPDTLIRGATRAADDIMHAFGPLDLPPGWRDPFWRMVLQFKSYIYKQTEFMLKEAILPAMRWIDSNGKQGSMGPMIRLALASPIFAEATQHLRDLTRAVPRRILTGEWDMKDPFWDEPDPSLRLLTDMAYIGSFGILGDALDEARAGRLAESAWGPTVGDAFRLLEAGARGDTGALGRRAERLLPGHAILGLRGPKGLLEQLGIR